MFEKTVPPKNKGETVSFDGLYVEKAVESVNNLVRKVRKMSETVFFNPSKNGKNQTFLQYSVIKQNDYKNLLHVCNFLYVVICWKNGLLNGVNYDADF